MAPGRRALTTILATAARVLFAVGAAGAASGDLSYEGCITGETERGPTPGSAACTAIATAQSGGSGSGLNTPTAAAVSADGSSVYMVGQVDDSVARFNRNPATGDLAYKGCISGDIATGPSGTTACALIPTAVAGGTNSGLDTPGSVAVSADGASLYVSSTGDDAVVR